MALRAFSENSDLNKIKDLKHGFNNFIVDYVIGSAPPTNPAMVGRYVPGDLG